MGTRNSVARLIPGNALGSILRETAREARRTSRNAIAPPDCCDQVAALQASQAALLTQVQALQASQAALPRSYTTTVVTGAGGFGTWTYPTPFVNTPFLFAQVVDGSPWFWSIFAPTNTGTQVITWDYATVTGTPGVTVNLMAVSAD